MTHETEGFPFETDPPSPVAQALGEDDFIEARPVVQRTKPPGPGLPEACLWMFGALVVHILGGIIVAIGLTIWKIASTGSLAEVQRPEFISDSLLVLAAGEQFICLLVIALALVVRWQGHSLRNLNFAAPKFGHLLLTVLLVLPLSIIVGEHYRLLDLGWQWLAEHIPALDALNELSAVEAVQELAKQAPLPVMILVIAVGPAISEELLCRGVIGRGLVARWGPLWGIALSSLLFGAMHVHPVHATAVVLLGVVIHCVYLATRSFWLPVLYHFLNNAWATVASYLAADTEMALFDESQPADRWLLVLAHAVVVLAAGLLWQSRCRYVNAEGVVWSPGYISAEAPPDAGWDRKAAWPSGWVLLGFVLAIATFYGLASREVMASFSK